MNVSKITSGALAVALMAGTASLAAPAAHASEVIARDQAGVVIAQDQSAKLTAEATAPRTITVTTTPGTAVTVTANKSKKAKPRTVIAGKDGKATFSKLTAGRPYTVQADGQRTTAVPVVNVGKASDLTVTTTDRVDTVDLTWSHEATKARGQVGYTVTATPVTTNQNANDDAITPISIEATSTSVELSGLNPLALYSFTVTPHNELGNGGASVARMSRSLADITGLPAPASDPADVAKPEVPASPAPQPAAQPAPQPAPQPGPAPAPQPSTRTIWVCPDGFSDEAGTCTQTREYTYTESTETASYTYSQNFHQTGWQDGSFSPAPCTFGTYHANGPQGEGCYVAAGPTGYYTTDKNAPPAGWTDNGSEYTRTVSTKDATPAGYSDSGTAWVRTTDKVAKVVPA